ncbi:site-2 protease family protein [Methanotorris formicicus]|uniref:Peptidase M50 n=1 Tax=Methanotorris formicicus Mc-S-70 TaxID=647171 RepID=H1L0J8_9EURY|nr:site-2 protease family protein [Methanotorris formicicus]EHP84753.1 peptidase M50 [Methanotorris formicicus Mc-S-70]
MESTSRIILIIALLIWIFLYAIRDTINLKTYFGVFGILRTKIGMKTIEKLGNYEFWKKLAILSIPICVIIGFFTFFSLIESTLKLMSGELPKEASKPIIFLFGSVIPWIPGIIGLIVGITIHELAHGIVAYAFRQEIKSTGLLLALGIPLGAFVELGDEFKNLDKKIRGAIASAGPMANIVVFLIVVLITPQLYSIPTELTITKTYASPAMDVLNEGDTIYSINGIKINSLKDFHDIVKNLKPNEKITITVLRENELKTFNLITSKEGKIGIVVEPSKNLAFVLNICYWTYWMNLLLGFFNLLPALPLDGYYVWVAFPRVIGDLKLKIKSLEKLMGYISNILEMILNEKNLNAISVLIWWIIFGSMIYSFI